MTWPDFGCRSTRAAICDRCDPAFYLLRCKKTQDLKNSLTFCQTLARQIPSSPKRQMVTNDNRFAKLAVPPSEKRGLSAATLKSKIFDDTPLSMSMRLNWRASPPPAKLAARAHWPAQMTTTSRDRALAAALRNSGHPAQCGQCRRSSKPAWVATRVAASPPKARAGLYGGAATPLRPHRL